MGLRDDCENDADTGAVMTPLTNTNSWYDELVVEVSWNSILWKAAVMLT